MTPKSTDQMFQSEKLSIPQGHPGSGIGNVVAVTISRRIRDSGVCRQRLWFVEYQGTLIVYLAQVAHTLHPDAQPKHVYSFLCYRTALPRVPSGVMPTEVRRDLKNAAKVVIPQWEWANSLAKLSERWDIRYIQDAMDKALAHLGLEVERKKFLGDLAARLINNQTKVNRNVFDRPLPQRNQVEEFPPFICSGLLFFWVEEQPVLLMRDIISHIAGPYSKGLRKREHASLSRLFMARSLARELKGGQAPYCVAQRKGGNAKYFVPEEHWARCVAEIKVKWDTAALERSMIAAMDRLGMHEAKKEFLAHFGTQALLAKPVPALEEAAPSTPELEFTKPVLTVVPNDHAPTPAAPFQGVREAQDAYDAMKAAEQGVRSTVKTMRELEQRSKDIETQRQALADATRQLQTELDDAYHAKLQAEQAQEDATRAWVEQLRASKNQQAA